MKKTSLLFCLLLSHNVFAAYDISLNDVYKVGGGFVVGAIAFTIGGNYWHQAALKREELAAVQEDKRIKEQKELREDQKKENDKKNRLEALAFFQKTEREYSQEIQGLSSKKNLDREQHGLIIKSKQPALRSRYKDYGEKLESVKEVLNRNSIFLSPEENKAQNIFLTKLDEIHYRFNQNFQEDKNAEAIEAERAKHQEEEDKLKLEEQRLKVKEQKLRNQVQEGKLEAQNDAKQNKERYNTIINKIDAVLQHQKGQELRFLHP